MMFKEAGLLRLVGTPHKVSHFVLNVPGESNHFLICQHCGQMAELPAVKALTRLEQTLAETKGFSAIYHELEVYGICPSCRGKTPSDAAKEKGMTLKIGVKTPQAKPAALRRCHSSP
jgi:Fe2+ or Zn2+ uptake regulation protein